MDSEQRPLSSIYEAFEGAPCGLLATTVDGTIVRVNSTFCGWVGYEAQELLEKRRIQDLLTIGGKLFHQTHWAPLLQMQRSVAEVKVDMIHRDGRKVPMLINAARRRHGDVEYNEPRNRSWDSRKGRISNAYMGWRKIGILTVWVKSKTGR
jgi:PAS domain S-box-containing protein